MPEAQHEPLVPIGRVIAAHGIRGEVKVQLYHGESRLLEELDTLLLRSGAQAQPAAWKVIAARGTPRGWLVRLEGLTDRSAAEKLIHSELVVPRAALPEPEEGEYYYRDLVGLAVLDRGGRSLGAVAEVFDNGANDVLVVRDGERELLLPFIDEVVVEVDVPGGKLLVDPPEGLLEQ